MHEFSMTSQIVERVLQEAMKRGAREVTEVHLVIGKLTFLGIEQMRFAYKILVEGTIMDGSNLFIEEKEGIVKCVSCRYEGSFNYEDDPSYHIRIPTLNCPKCGGSVEIVGGKECVINKVELVVPKVAKVDG